MTEPAPFKNGLNTLLTPQDSVLILIDHQPFQFANLHSHEPMMIVNNVIGLAKAAKVFNVPTILSTVVEDRGGKLIKGLQEGLPRPEADRPYLDQHLGRRAGRQRGETGRKKLVMAALWTEICLAMPAIQAAGEGYEVYAVTNASGGVSAEAHEMGVRRMMMAGVVPMNWLAVASEWQRDWARQDSAKALGEFVLPHTGAHRDRLRVGATASRPKNRRCCLKSPRGPTRRILNCQEEHHDQHNQCKRSREGSCSTEHRGSARRREFRGVRGIVR